MSIKVKAPIIITSRKSATPYNTLLRSAERRVVLTESGGVFLSPFSVVQEIWDVKLPDRGGILNNIDGIRLAEKNIIGEKSKMEYLPDMAGYLAAAIREIHFGEVEKQVVPWDEVSRFLWSGATNWTLAGGMTTGSFGVHLARHMTHLLDSHSFKVGVSQHRRRAGIVGTAEFLPLSALSTKSDITNFIGLDLGGSSLKIALIHVVSATGKVVKAEPYSFFRVENRPSEIPFDWDAKLTSTFEERLEMRQKSLAWLTDAIEKMVLKANQKGLKLAPYIVMGVPQGVDEKGRMFAGGAYPLWTADDFLLNKELQERLGKLLIESVYSKQTPDSDNIQEYSVIYGNDAIIAGAGLLPNGNIEKMGYLIWGSSFGGALFLNLHNPLYHSLI